MHPQAHDFTIRVKILFPEYFRNKDVLDCGSGDINGNNRHLFDNCQYTGIDIFAGSNVDIVTPIHEFKPDKLYDVIISTECFEHDMYFMESLRNMVSFLKEDGLFIFTCASTNRGEHGTLRTTPENSLSVNIVDHSKWYPNYYRNLTPEDIQKSIPIHLLFDKFSFEADRNSCDMYFWGIKNKTLLLPKINYMEEIFNKHDTDKNSKFHNYTRQYECYFDPYRYKSKVNYLEIGNYGSLRAIREYLPNALYIVGIDINLETKVHEDSNCNIYIEIGNPIDTSFLTLVNHKYGGFDIILDDGSHYIEDIIISFETLFPLLRNGGMYIVEDTCCYKNYKRDPNSPDHLTYFSKYFQGLNRWEGGSVDVNKLPKSENPFDNMIDSITYGVSHILIRKI